MEEAKNQLSDLKYKEAKKTTKQKGDTQSVRGRRQNTGYKDAQGT